jgi:FMN phosphatase YigB (HAD superfamily)
MGYAPQDVVFLDDTLENVSGAREAGLDAYHTQSEAAVAAKLRSLIHI